MIVRTSTNERGPGYVRRVRPPLTNDPGTKQFNRAHSAAHRPPGVKPCAVGQLRRSWPSPPATFDGAVTRPQATSVDVSATDVITMWQAEGVLMELLQVDAAEALSWLTSTAAQRGQPVAELAAEVVEHRSI